MMRRIEFRASKGRKMSAQFSGGSISSDGGVLLLRQADQRLGLVEKVSRQISDPRQASKCRHSVHQLLQQRIYGIALGYEDLNDHQELRGDPGFQAALNQTQKLGSDSTLCRMEQWADRNLAVCIHQILLETFINSFDSPPSELILDFDPTDDRVHGQQEKCFYHGYYRQYCFLPLYVFCGDFPLVSYLRDASKDQATHTGAILKLLVSQLRKQWPDVRIIFRADGGLCRHKTLNWCERQDVQYVVGYSKNSVVTKLASKWIEQAQDQFDKTGEKQRMFGEFQYEAKTWSRKRRVIVKAEYLTKGPNTRYILSNLKKEAQIVYEKIYCARGEMENHIKEQQLDLFADRTSCQKWWPNQLRLLLSTLASVLIITIRRLALKATALEKATCGTIRLKLLKIGSVILTNTRQVRFLLSSSYPLQNLFFHVAEKLKPG